MTSVATAAAPSLEVLVADYPRGLPVLVVDDDEDVRSVIGRCLEKFEVKVVESATLRNARDRFRAGEEFSFVFLDRCLPDGDGVDFAQEILEWSPNLAVAIVTAMGNGPNAEKALKGGAFAYLPKPCSISDIRKALFKRYPRLSDSFRDGEQIGRAHV